MDLKEQIKIVDSWLKDISRVAGVDLAMNPEGICTLQIGEDVIAIEISPDFPMIHLYSVLLPLPQEDKDLATSLLIRALELNAFQVLTRGGAVAMAPGGGLLIYCYSIFFEGMDSEKFSGILGAFYETLPEIKQMLTSTSAIEGPSKERPPKGIVP